MTILVFIVLFGVIVLFHELGHFAVARAVGIRVHEFAVGFGPVLARIRRQGTAYSIRALPLGGYVRLAGMDPAEAAEGDPRELFHARPLWQRMATIAAGPLMNFVLAILLSAAYFGLIAIPPTVTGVLAGKEAARAGIRPQDQIVAIGDRPVKSVAEIIEAIQSHAGLPIEFTLRRGGDRRVVTAVPERDPERGGIGVLGVELFEQRPLGPIQAFEAGALHVGRATGALVQALLRMVTGRERPELTGPYGLVKLTSDAARQGIAFLLLFAVGLNINLGLLNLLPIPMLDGGWLLFLGLEGVRGRPLAPEQRGMAQFIGLAILVLMMLFATYQDLLRYFFSA